MIKNKQNSIDEKQLCRLIESHPEVDYYGLGVDEIQAVIRAYAKVVKDAVEVNVKIPFPELGEFYTTISTYKGGISNLTNPPTVLPPKHYKVLKFRVKKGIREKLKGENLLDE